MLRRTRPLHLRLIHGLHATCRPFALSLIPLRDPHPLTCVLVYVHAMASKVTSPLSPLMPSSVMNSLPQYGFGPEVTFEGLVAGNPFLFRVHTPRAQPPEYDSSEPYFVGAKYSDEFSSAAISSSSPRSQPTEPASSACTYADVVRHLDWTTRQSSPYISASFSFAWAIWEAIRRYHANVKHDVEIAVIDARAVSDRSITAVELLMRGSPKE